VLWKGVDLARFDRAHAEAARKRAELGLASDELAVGTVGRLAWQKGIDDLLEAVRRLRPRLPRARFFVAGGGRDAGAVAAAAAALRAGARAWLEANLPHGPRPTELAARAACDQAWQRRMYDSGWAGIAWPRAHGGRGATLMEQLVWCEEYARAGAPDISTLFV